MTNKEIYDLFCNRFNIKTIDYRPLAGDMFVKDREGITVFCDNGDIILYFPNVENKRMSTDDVIKIAENMKNNRPDKSISDELKEYFHKTLSSLDTKGNMYGGTE